MLPRIQNVVTGEFARLSPEGLTVSIRSAFFQKQGDLIGSLSYPGTMPLEENLPFIKNAHIIHSDAKLRTFQVRVWLGDIPWKLAKFSFIRKDKQISYTLYIDMAVSALQLKTLRLNNLPDDVNYDQQNFGSTAAFQAYMNSSVTAPAAESPAVFFPIKNDGAYKTIDPADYGSYPDFALPWDVYMNSWSIDAITGTGSFLIDMPGDDHKHTVIPAWRLPYVLKRLALYLGYTPVGKWLDEDQANRIVIVGVQPTVTNDILPDFTYFMPDMGVTEFFEVVRLKCGIQIDFDQLSGICVIESIENLKVTDDIIDLRDEQLIRFEELPTALSAYSITEGADDNDKAFADIEKGNLPVLNIGDISEASQLTEVPLQSVATKMIAETAPDWAQSQDWRIPWLKQSLYGATPFDQISELSYGDRHKFGLRLLYYHGLQPTASGYLYPYGSADNVNLNGDALTDYSLSLDAPAGTNISVKNYYGFMKNSKPFEMDFELAPEKFLKITPRARILVRDPETEVTVSCLLDEIKADLDRSEKVKARATLYPIVIPVNTQQELPSVPADVEPPFDNGTVYVRLSFRNTQAQDFSFPPPPRRDVYQDIYAEFFADAGATTPKSVTRLDVHIKTSFTYSVGGGASGFRVIRCTTGTNEFKLYNKTLINTSTAASSTSYFYELATDAKYHILP